jgi:predicted nucleic acid-binding protein
MKYVVDASVLRTSFLLFDSMALLRRATAISSSYGHGFYDCVSLAEREGCEFVTADAKLIAKQQKLFPFIIALSALP